jgi:hypothetical protein
VKQVFPKEEKMTTKLKDVFVITEREDQDKAVWSKIGIAFVNKDESLNVILDAVPVTGKLHIRERQYKPTNKEAFK